MESVFHAATAAKQYRAYNAWGQGNVMKGWRWIRAGEKKGSRKAYDSQLEALMGCCRSRNIDVIAHLDNFTKHYLIAALWTEEDSLREASADGDASFDLCGIDDNALHKAWLDCQKFQLENSADLAAAYEFYTENGNAAHPDAGSPEACAGHDFWLTRCGHGVGFWDRGMGPLGDTLSDVCRKWGNVDIYVNSRGKVDGF